MQNVFVTGATGLLGSSLVKRLVKDKKKVVILLRDYVPESDLLKSKTIDSVSVVRGELEDFEFVLRALNEYEIDTVIHLGAQTIVPIANNNPLSTFEANIKGTWNVLEASRLLKTVKKIIVASTDKAYGDQPKLPYTEEMPLLADTPYDVSKACGEYLCRAYVRTYGLCIGILRCGNIYGPGDLNFNRIIPGALKAALLNEPLQIRSNGKFLRDYVFMEDIVEGYIRFAESIEKLPNGTVLNLSTNHPYTVMEIVDEVASAAGVKIKTEILDIVKAEIKSQYLSSKKAEELLGWKAKHSLKDGLKKTIPWYKEYLGLSR